MWVLRNLWALPMTLFSFGMLLTLYFPRAIRWQDGAFQVVVAIGWLIPAKWVGGQSHGGLITFYRSAAQREREDLRYHEGVHQEQGGRWGIFFWLLYVGDFIYQYAKRLPNWRDYQSAYRAIRFEVEARQRTRNRRK